MAVREGDPGPAFAFGPVTLTDLVRYAGASLDFNPLHHDGAYAREAGYAGVIAHGMFSAGLLGSFVTAWFGASSVRRYRVRFREPVAPGDVLAAEGSVTSLFDHDGRPCARLELRLLRGDGLAVVTGEAEVRLDRAAEGGSPR